MLISINANVFAQNPLQIVMGTVRNESNYEHISFAVIKNEMQRTKIVADENGSYVIPVNRGDLLKITAIGFEDGFYIINDSAELIKNFPIQLQPKIYELKEFTIAPYKTVLQFKHAFAQLELPEENLVPELNLGGIRPSMPDAEPGHLAPFVIQGPISAIYNTFSHRGKMAKKYQSLAVADVRDTLTLRRFRQIRIDQLLPIETKEDLEDFLAFCNFDFSFLENASDYELIAVVMAKYEGFSHSRIP